MALVGDGRGRLLPRHLRADRMPVGALPVIVCRLRVTLNLPGLHRAVVFPLRVNVRKRCRTGDRDQHRHE